MLIARPLDPQHPERRLAITGELRATPPGDVAVYVSEAAADLYGWAPGAASSLLPSVATQRFRSGLARLRAPARCGGARRSRLSRADRRRMASDAAL
ncbi:MAG: hypothetical protein KF786_14270 [Burkholderiaceae bacterium]|nr:hypothetical protein [Burkholderiaceae bacterium]